MTSFAGQIFVESALLPAIVSGLIVLPARWSSHWVFCVLASAAAILAAILLSYVSVFGWPAPPALGARQKILLLTVVSVLLGMGFSLDKPRFDRAVTAFFVIAPLWIGWPALKEGRLSLGLLVLPIAVGLWVHSRSKRRTDDKTELCLLLVAMALGLAAIALFARTLSITQLGLALAATLTAIVLAGPKPPTSMIAIAGAAMLSGLLCALLLYSEASLPAMIVLCAVLLSPPFASLLVPPVGGRRPLLPSLLTATAITMIAAGIAWIDAGSISVYEGAQDDRVVLKEFVLRGDDGHGWKDP